MDLPELLLSKNFIRTRLPLAKPIVIHAVAGAGKTQLLEEFARSSPSTKIYSPVKHHSNSLLLSPFHKALSEASIVDEYPLSQIHENVEYIFADPIQYLGNPNLRKPHYICASSHRFGHSTAALLTKIGIETYAHKEDTVRVDNIFQAEPDGQIIACDRPTQELAARHTLDYLRPCESIGLTFPRTTILISHELTADTLTKEIYIGLTRHSNHLLILTPDASTTSS
uniref:25 kDa triple gene block protein n=1 Tax=Citrus yellow vein clearing virus TaxID=1214459 RepID=A0A1D8X817_9VIRU|nr:25 kDa triple gene block protein [Citrus yellow vein clearing virus]